MRFLHSLPEEYHTDSPPKYLDDYPLSLYNVPFVGNDPWAVSKLKFLWSPSSYLLEMQEGEGFCLYRIPPV